MANTVRSGFDFSLKAVMRSAWSVLALGLAAFACSSGSSDSGTSAGGSENSAGSASSAGSSASSAGSTGNAGTVGSAGSNGTAGAGASAGSNSNGGASGGAGASGSAGAAGSAGASGAAGAGNLPPGVGANTPFISYEAEAGTLGGGAAIVALTSPPTSQFSSPELESSGHAYVALKNTGDYVEWKNQTGKSITFVNVRASIPDAPNGGGITATLDLYVNGSMRQTLTLDSKQTYGYEGNNHYNNESQSPSDGNPRTFWDEYHGFLQGAPLAPGDTIRLQRDAANSASFYDIDVIDVEAPPPPATEPAGSLSITDYGAKANDPNTDNSTSIQNAINDAQSQKKTLWIPQGTFYFKSTGGLSATGITIEGAGMWYSTVYRNLNLPNGTPLGAIFNLDSCHVHAFALDSNALSRQSADGAGGGMDTTGTNWTADAIWTQHTESGFWASGTGGTVMNCRLTAIWADGCNLNNVSRGATVGTGITAKNNFVRGTGDDGIAINSVNYNGNQMYTPMSNITIENNTSIAM
ncbi:MAG TPA: hypothetical protein VGM44_17410, partial [Polyangiaceae bacterium]